MDHEANGDGEHDGTAGGVAADVAALVEGFRKLLYYTFSLGLSHDLSCFSRLKLYLV